MNKPALIIDGKIFPIEILNLKKGDLIVVKFSSGVYPDSCVKNLYSSLEGFFPHNKVLLVNSDEVEIELKGEG